MELSSLQSYFQDVFRSFTAAVTRVFLLRNVHCRVAHRHTPRELNSVPALPLAEILGPAGWTGQRVLVRARFRGDIQAALVRLATVHHDDRTFLISRLG